MITIIHGDDTAASRKYFSTLKAGSKDALSLSGNMLSVTNLAQILEGGGLFADPKDIFIEDFLSQKKQSADSKAAGEYLLSHTDAHNIYIWEGKEITRTVLSQYKSAVIKSFKIPQVLFQFLDSLKPGNSNSIKLFHELLEQTETELIFFMLVRHFRLLIAVKSGAIIEETKRMADWQKAKCQKQANLFSEVQLKNIYQQLQSIDVLQKSGGLPYTLSSSIDFFLLDL